MAGIFPCPDPRDLQRLLLGWVTDAEAESLEQHCDVCPDCLETMRSLEADDALVAAVRVGEGAPLAPLEEVNTKLLERIYGLGVFLSPAPEAAPPATLPGYEIHEKLGSGGMGVVYKATQLRPRRLVALKLLRGGSEVDRDELARFRAEAELAARLEHPNIIRVYEVGEWRATDLSPALPYFAMEYVEGGSLADRLAVATLGASDAARLVEALNSRKTPWRSSSRRPGKRVSTRKSAPTWRWPL